MLAPAAFLGPLCLESPLVIEARNSPWKEVLGYLFSRFYKKGTMFIRRTLTCAVVLGFFAWLTTSCSNTANTDLIYKAAINDHFKAFPACIWSQPKKFPVQAATSDDVKTEG
ncbi:MAG: hypothetical protein WAM65_16085, partial [Candidatus Korobacteraceae bacterium]